MEFALFLLIGASALLAIIFSGSERAGLTYFAIKKFILRNSYKMLHNLRSINLSVALGDHFSDNLARLEETRHLIIHNSAITFIGA